MTMVAAEGERGIESQLADVSHMPLRQLRVRDDAILIRAISHVVERVTKIRVNECGSGSRRLE